MYHALTTFFCTRVDPSSKTMKGSFAPDYSLFFRVGVGWVWVWMRSGKTFLGNVPDSVFN